MLKYLHRNRKLRIFRVLKGKKKPTTMKIYKLADYEKIQALKTKDTFLAIDNNIDGVRRLAVYNKSFLSKKINASGNAYVYHLRKGFLSWEEKLIAEYIFED